MNVHSTASFACAFLTLSSLAMGLAHSRPVAPSHRIVINKGRFVDSCTGKAFLPLGFNYFRVGAVADGKREHVALHPDFYDAAFVDAMMADGRKWGFNTVRVFMAYDTGPRGVVSAPDATSLNPAYVACVVDFLRKARAHDMHVILTSDWSPNSAWLASMRLPTEDRYPVPALSGGDFGTNVLLLGANQIRTRFNLIVQLISAIQSADPSLSSTVLAWELQNESSFVDDKAPLLSGSDASKQALMDAIAARWANIGADAIHAADPGALVSDSVFTFAAVGRKGPGSLSTDGTHDHRIPIRPLALVPTHLDFLDIHTYAWASNDRTVADHAEIDLRSDEWDSLKAAANSAGKPTIAGETGLFRGQALEADRATLDPGKAERMLRDHLSVVKNAGFAGALYWSYGSADSKVTDSNPPLRLFPDLGAPLSALFGRASD